MQSGKPFGLKYVILVEFCKKIKFQLFAFVKMEVIQETLINFNEKKQTLASKIVFGKIILDKR